jgi:hypothetical protein
MPEYANTIPKTGYGCSGAIPIAGGILQKITEKI